ncbi:MAG: AAA family ATPase [Allosphingosinicella sp.]
MQLRSILLRNWKGYRRTRLRIPPGEASRNVVILEGYNGAGKTSLLEAIQLCLYGRSGLPLLARAADNGRRDASYDEFLERGLSIECRGRPERISIALEFADDDSAIALERIWHFNASGRHRPRDEEVRILAGRERDLVELPDEPETASFVRDFVARELLPPNLAPFFLLDGEHLDQMAGKGLDEQVQAAVEAVLGAPTLKGMATDLRDYARERRKQIPQATGGITTALAEELTGLEETERQTIAEVDALVDALQPLRSERDSIVRRIGSLHGDSYASFKALFEERESVVRSRESQQDELRHLLSGELALALSGGALRRRAIERIAAEDRAERWESASAASRSKFTEYLEILRHSNGVLSDELVASLGEAWGKVWSERPADCASDIRFSHLGETDRRSVAQHLERLSSVKSESIADLARAVAAADLRIETIEREIARQRGLDGESQALANKLNAIQEQIASAEAEHRSRVATLESLRARLSDKHAEADLILTAAADAAPILARARRADLYAELADRLIEAALPANLDELSQTVTGAYRAMAHKSVVERVRIRLDGAVELLAGDGADIREQDASAGEHQIFALSIVSALADLAGRFPIIMDTPLARLDPVHRRNVLEHFSRRGGQLILLTHPAELGPHEIEILGDRLTGTISIGSRPEAVSQAEPAEGTV